MRKLVLDQVNEDLFEFGLLDRSSKRKNRSVVDVAKADSASKIRLINQIVDLNVKEDQGKAVEATSVVAVAFQKGQKQEKREERKETISIPTGSQQARFRPSTPRFSPLTS